MMTGKQQEHQRKKGYWSRSVTGAFRLSFGLCHFWWILKSLVMHTSGFLLKCDELSMFGKFSFHRIDYFTCKVPGRWDIVQIMQFLLIGIPKCRVIEHCLKSTIQVYNNMHNFYKFPKDYAPVFNKLIW